MVDDEYKFDLFWHALNYRGAFGPQQAEAAWFELEACCQRKIDAAVEQERERCAATWDKLVATAKPMDRISDILKRYNEEIRQDKNK